MKILDLSQEIFAGMPVFDGHPEVEMNVAVAHEQEGGDNSATRAPSAHKITLGEHTGTPCRCV